MKLPDENKNKYNGLGVTTMKKASLREKYQLKVHTWEA
jgi:hypothetical protein